MLTVKFLPKINAICLIIAYPLMNYAQLDEIEKNLELLNDSLQLLNDSIGSGSIEVPQPVIIKPLLVNLPWIAQNQSLQLYQVRSLPQKGGAVCGYYALYNGLIMLNYILKPAQRPDILKKLYSAISYVNFADEFKGEVVRERTRTNVGNKDGSWLQGDELEELVIKIAGSNVLRREGLSIANPTAYFTVIDNIEWLDTSRKESGTGILSSMISTIEEFRKQPNFAHVFLLAFSREYVGKTGYIAGTSTHWIAVVVNKVQDQAQYLILDSANADRTQNDDVITLRDVLQTASIVDMKIKVLAIDSEISTITKNLSDLKSNNNDIKKRAAINILDLVSKIIQVATTPEADFFNAPEFARYKADMVNAIFNINDDEDITSNLDQPHQQQLKELVAILLPD